ncbi:MAG: S1C family serine protease [Bacillota bacterium]
MYGYNDYNNNYQYRPPKRGNRVLIYIAIILVTSLVSSFAVGSYLYGKFSREIASSGSNALNSKVAAENSENSLNQDAPEISQPDKDTGSTPDTAENSAGPSRDIIIGNVSGSILNTSLLDGSNVVVAIAKKAGPAIVGIRVTVEGTRYGFYGVSNTRVGEGSGIIISSDGYILTNYHVVSYADPKNNISGRKILEVFLPDGREANAVFVGGDSKTDLALIKIDLKNLPVAELGDSSKLEVGELAVAIGNPLGMEFAGSVTVGVISALNRTVDMGDKTLNLIQTDAAINQGNSGGALLNSKGQVVGINSAKISTSGVEGLGFAIPINDAKPVIEQLKKYGYVRGRPFIGISGEEVSSVYTAYYGWPKGIYITNVTRGSGAEKAGIRAGDILVSLGGVAVETMKDLDNAKSKYKPGDSVTVKIYRSGKEISLKLTFGEET